MKLTPEQLEKLSPERRALLQKMLAERTSAKRASQAAPDVPRRQGDGPAPLSFAQQRLWFIQQLDRGNPAYNMPAGMRLRGPLDTSALRRALAEIVRRHEALRTVFAVPGEGEPVQVVLPPAPVPLPAVDLSGLRPEGRERELSRHAFGESLNPFDLETGPLLRSALLRLAPGDHAVLFTLHHIVSDGWSMGVLVREVSELYAAFAEGRPSPLPELPVQYPDYAVWQREHVSGRRLEEQLEFWKRKLAGAPSLLELPTDRPRPAVEDSAGARYAFRLSPELSAAVYALTRREGATPFMTLLAALQLVLARWSGQGDVVVGSPLAGRTRVDLEGLIGMFVNTLAMRTDLSGDPTVGELLARVRATVLEAQSNQDLPFERLVEEVAPERTLAHSPVFQVLLALQNVDSGSLQLGAALEVQPLPVAFTTAKFDLNWSMEEFPQGFGGAVSYRSSLWDEATVARVVDHLRAVLAGMAAHPELPVSRIELLTPGERHRVLRAWNATDADYAVEGGLAGLFEAQAARTPGAEALVFGTERLTYAELDRRAAALAARLHALGAGTDARVGLCLERSTEMVVGVLGILKAGAAYVPIDPEYPEDRVAYMLEDAGISVLLTQQRLVARLPELAGEVVLLDGDGSTEYEVRSALHTAGQGDGGSSSGDEVSLRTSYSVLRTSFPDSLAYVVYTSGSTGRPKGVAMQQRPLLNLVAWQRRGWRVPGPAVTLQFATISFDASFHEMFSCWAEGGTLVVAPEEARRDPAAVLELLEREGVERLFLPFVALQHLAEEALERGAYPRRLREVQTAGEQLRVTDAIRAWLGGLGIPLHNHYGPSETHVATALALDGDPARWPLLPSIGGPIGNSRCYVLDAELRPMPVGVPGELYLAGDCVARGYLGRPDLTAEKFLPDAHGRERGARMYRSGDRARWTAAGEVEFLGRVDQQVKVRGFRIEPGEVESALESHPAVREAVVVARDGGAGGRQLVGYVVAEDGAGAPAAAELRAWVAARLPEYMVPAALVALERLPLTPSGKTDRRALPAPDGAAREAYVAPRTPTEARVAEVFGAVLRRERVGAHDGFFALGGHSLLAMRVVSRVRDGWGVELPLRTLFEAPTVAGVAQRIEALLAAGGGAPADGRIRRRTGAGPAPLSFAQQRLWFIDRMEPGSAAYNLPSALRLRGPLDAAVLRRTLAEVARRHESLRTVFAEGPDGPVQTVLPAGPVALPAADLSALPGQARERELLRLAAEEAARPFDLARGPLLRSLLVGLGEAEHAVLFTLHHVVSDGWSTGVLVGEVSALYAAFAEGRPSPLPELPVQYADFALWQREQLSGEALEAQLGWWRERLAGAPPVLDLPTDRPRPPLPDPRGAALGFSLPADTTRGLRELAAREGTTLFGVLLAAWQVVLARWSGQDDVVVGTPVAGRTRTELEGLIGFFVNTLVLRTDLGGDPTLRELAGRARETVLGAQAHQDLPFERLVEELQPERSLRHTPLFQVLIALQNTDAGELRLGEVEMEPLSAGEGAAKFDLSLALGEHGEGVAGGLSYRAALWEEATLRRMLGHFRAALDALATDPDRRLSALELLGADERRLLAGERSRSGDAAAPTDRCVHELFAEQAGRTPDAVALVFGDESLTYAGLHARSRALAGVLAARGAGPDARVGICLERGPEMVVGMLAILEAGGAYVPLDPQYPAERLAWMLADAGVRLLLTQERLRGRFEGFGGEIVVCDGSTEYAVRSTLQTAGQADGGSSSGGSPLRTSYSVLRTSSPDNLAYVIYTSGSTGQPKGTEVPHRAIPGFFRGVEYARFDETTVVLHHSSPSWDVPALELWAPLLSGGTCVLYPGQASEPAGLGEQVRRHGVDTLWLTAAYFNLVVDTAPETLEGVRQVMTGGEAVSASHARRALELYPGLRLVNGYGPSETTVFATCHAIPAGFGGEAVPIGRPVGDRRVYLLDRHSGLVPQGAVGELCVGGPAVARGYLGRPELTAERFVPDPFGEPGARLYRTGDRARWNADGVLEFAGRVDFQAKIRGFRVEPGEVEAALASHPAVREAAVAVHEPAPGDRRLVGYATAAEGVSPDPAELRAWLGARMPEHMVPAAVVVLDAMPLTPRGKLDRRALPAPDAAEDEAYAAPRTPAEETLAAIWAEVLGGGRVGIHADFFALGGHSLLATRVVSRVRETFGVELPVRALFEAPTVAALAPRVEAALRAGTGAAEPAPPIVPVPRDGPLPLSFAQQRLWLMDRIEPGSAAYNIPTPLRLRGALDVRALRRALAEIVRRHEALRTVFAEVDGEPVQVVRPAGPVALPVVDLRRLPDAAREAETRRLADADGARPFDLARGPLLRAALLRAGEDDWGLLLVVHHIVSDGWSTGILVGEFSALYGEFSRGEASPLPEPPVQYADFAAWQRAWLSGGRTEAQLAYWRERLAGAPPALNLQTDRPRPAVPGTRGATRGFAFSAEASRAIREMCRREGVTPYMALLAAWQLLLARYAGVEDVSVGTAIAGRNRLELERLVGFFVNTLVLRADLRGRPDVREVLRRVREATLGAFAHQDVPFERLVEELVPERSLRQAPLFQVMFSFQNMDAGALELGGLEAAPLAWSGEAAKFDLSLSAREDGGRFAGFVTFRTELFGGETVERMLAHFATLAAAMAEDPERPAAALPLMDAVERTRVLAAAAGPVRDYPRGLPVHALFERQAARTPDAVAVAFGGGSLTYAGLDRRADALAAELLRRRLPPETRVGVFLERGPEWLVSLLAVLKAGAVYVPLDPANPAERIRYVLADSGASLLLTDGGLRGRVPEFGGEVVRVDGTPLPPTPSPIAGEGPGVRGPDADSLAYVIYTSGSTGQPKGVLTTHGGVASYLAFLADEYGLGPADTVLQLATPTFDASVRETLGALTTGARLVLTSSTETAEPRRVLERARAEGVTAIMAVVPSVLRRILAEAEQSADVARLRLLLVSGEPLSIADVRRAHAVFGADLRVVNQWGATECTMSSTLHTSWDDEETPIAPVGTPIPNTRVYVLDPELEPTPLGVPGEAYIATPGLARGYGGRPELTAERFVPHPFSAEPGARMYRVGDRVRRRRDGVLEFLGRVDQQVKVQGVRVEPGEVEAVLRAHPAVESAAVVAREDRPGEARLVAYVVAPDGVEATAAALRAYLADRLPSYMVPSGWVSLDALPLLPNGKLDRRALPDPEASAAEAAYVAPRTPTEEILAGIWAEVLGAERVGLNDDFFALGGHSLLAARMTARVRGALGTELPLRALFEAPTLAGAAARVDAALREGAGDDAPPLVPTPRDGRPLPLSFAQQRLWFIHRLAPESAAYNMPHPLRLEGALDVRALRRGLDALAARHEPLRTVFTEAGGEPAQEVRPASRVPLPVVDVAGLPAERREREIRRLAAGESLRPFDLARGPLLRALLVRAGAEEHGLLFTLHHAIADGWSLGVLTREVAALYDAFSRGDEPRLPALPVQYADYAAWQRAWLRGDVLERHLAWWRERLAGAPPLLDLPTDRPRPPVMGEAAANVGFVLPAELAEALRALSRRQGATLFMALLAGWQALLGRWSGQDDVSVGVPVAGRDRVEVEGLIGMFVNTLVMRAGIRPGEGFRALLGRVRETALGAYAHQEVPFEKLVEELGVERSRRHTPLFQASFALQNMEIGEPRLGSLRLSPLAGSGEAAKFDLRLTMTETGDGVHAVLAFRSELFDAATAARMAGGLRALLEAAAADPELPVGRLPLLTPAERRQAVEAGRPGAPAAPDPLPVHEAFARQAALTPAAVALVAGTSELTCAELDRWSGRLARHLRGLGVGPETRVAVALERSPELVVSLLAVLKAGGAYVPLDPEYPAERLAGMLEDAGARLVITVSALADRFPAAGAGVLRLDEARERVARESDAPLEGGAGPDSLAYVVFTSGSTGRPKGVAVPHGALANHMAWMQRVFPLAPGDRVLQKTPAGFDASVWEFWAPLLAGATLALAPPGAHRDPAALLRAVQDERATVLQLVPSVLAAVLEHGGLERCATLRRLFCGGEALPADLAARARAALRGAEVVNLYGPTESTIDATWHVFGAADAGAAVPIGRPTDGVEAHVLDPEGEPVPAGVAGELCLGGAQLARGYLGRPEWTAAAFVPDGLPGAAGARLYRTGDRVRRRADGALEFLGRVDDQVKIRGFRIEPGEVEAALERHPGVARAAVAARADASGGPRLVGYVVPAAGAAPDAAELRAWLRGRLPEHMVPAAWVALDGLPLTPSGKTDRRALPRPDAPGAAGPVPPRTVFEEIVAEVWAEVLKTDRVGVFDDFFALGGHSLLATRVVARLREETGEEVPLRVMFDAPTVAALAAYLERRLMEDEQFAGEAGWTSPDPGDGKRRV